MSERPGFYYGITPDDELRRQIAETRTTIEVAELEFQLSDFKDETFDVLHFAAQARLAELSIRLDEYYSLDAAMGIIDDDPDL